MEIKKTSGILLIFPLDFYVNFYKIFTWYFISYFCYSEVTNGRRLLQTPGRQ